MDVLAITTLILGLVLGTVSGAAWTARQIARRKAAAGTSAVLARILPDTLPVRSTADILAGRIRLVLGGVPYDLPVKSRREGRAWLEALDERFHGLASALEDAEAPEILRLLAANADGLYDMLTDYAGPDVLPTRDSLGDWATEAEILRGVLEVWAALHPLAVALVANSRDENTPNGTSPEPSRQSPTATAGALTTSTGG